MNSINYSYLSIEEQVLLSSLDSSTKNDCINELEELLEVTPQSEQGYDVLVSLIDNLKNNRADLSSDRSDEWNDVPNEYTPEEQIN